MTKTKKLLHKHLEKLWTLLNDQSLKVDMYKIAKTHKFLPKGWDKQFCNLQGGLLLEVISRELTKNPSIAPDFGLNVEDATLDIPFCIS